MNKYIFGIGGVLIVAFCTIAIMAVGFSNAKASNYQVNAISCLTSDDHASKQCKQMPKFGVAPSAYINDEYYRKTIDSKYIKAIELNAMIAPRIAQFTLDHGVKKNVKFLAHVYKELNEIIDAEIK
jgi:hypothetical protein